MTVKAVAAEVVRPAPVGDRSVTNSPARVWLTPAEAAAILGVSLNTVYRALEAGNFPAPSVKLGRQWRISRLGLDRLAGAA